MNKKELLETFIKLVEHANKENADCIQICIHTPDGGELRCIFEYETILQEDNND